MAYAARAGQAPEVVLFVDPRVMSGREARRRASCVDRRLIVDRGPADLEQWVRAGDVDDAEHADRSTGKPV